MIKAEGMEIQLQNQMVMPQANHNKSLYAPNPAIYANQYLLNSEVNLSGMGSVQQSSNQNLNGTYFVDGSASTYIQFLKQNKAGDSQNESNNSQSSVPPNQQNINKSSFKNKRIIVKHSNIVKKKRQIKIWTNLEDEQLKRLHDSIPGKWNEIAQQITGRNASQCSQRWRRILPTKVRKPWTHEEDQKVLELSEKYGKNWGMIAQHVDGKTGKQVRERYINKLDPNIKRSPWSEEEDQKILDMFLELGPKWSTISNELIGRPENTVKNRFYSHISRIYLADDNSYIGSKNNDNNQKIKDAMSKNSEKFNQNKDKVVKNLENGNDAMEEEDNENEEDHDEDDDEDEEDEYQDQSYNATQNHQNGSVIHISHYNNNFMQTNNPITAGETASKKQQNQNINDFIKING